MIFLSYTYIYFWFFLYWIFGIETEKTCKEFYWMVAATFALLWSCHVLIIKICCIHEQVSIDWRPKIDENRIDVQRVLLAVTKKKKKGEINTECASQT